MASNQPTNGPDRHSHTFTTTTTTTTTSSSSRNGNSNTLTTIQTTPAIVRTEASSHASTEQFPGLPSEPVSRVPTNTLQPVASTSSPAFRSTISAVPGRLRPIGIQRLSSSNDLTRQTSRTSLTDNSGSTWYSRRRSASAPQHPGLQVPGQHEDGVPLQRLSTANSNLAPVLEHESQESQPGPSNAEDSEPRRSGSRRLRRMSDAAKSAVTRMSGSQQDTSLQRSDEYNSDVVDLLDVLDPEVSALTTLTNVQNSLFVPDLGRFLNRRPTYTLSRPPSRLEGTSDSKPLPPTPGTSALTTTATRPLEIPSDIDEEVTPMTSRRERRQSSASIASHIKDDHYAVLPHGVSLEGWTEDEKAMLDDYVRHMLHSRRSKFKQTMRAFGKYVSKPLGFFVTLYATLITLAGLAWVLFLIGWIYVGDNQQYGINIIDNVLVALFAIVGDGMIPFRTVDTYHMIYIAHYHHLSWRLRKEKALPKLHDHNDLPAKQSVDLDVEAVKLEEAEWSVLTPAQQKKLEHHQKKFSRSHSFYKPHETATHHAFPLRLLVAIVVLLDFHSIFQLALGLSTWTTSYKTRPKALTPTILCCSITVNILGGVLIKVGDGRTRKKEVLKQIARQELTQQAIKKVTKKVERSKSHEEQQEKEMEEEWDRKHAKVRSKEADISQKSGGSSEGF